MKKIFICDTLYDDFIRTVPFDSSGTYEGELQKVMDRKFGTFDAYSRNLNTLGWQTMDWISNHQPLCELWPHDIGPLSYFKPDVIFLQDLSIQIPRGDYLIAGQCSCRFPEEKDLKKCNVIFTSIPTHITTFEEMGIHSVYLPLAFDPTVLAEQGERDLDVVFVGGLGHNSFWENGTPLMELIASEFRERFAWYGYQTGPVSDQLKSRWMGTAWGTDMYRLYQRAKLVINRHGEISQGYSNNLRLYEATGCGALLLTEQSKNIWHLFSGREVVAYLTPDDAVQKIKHYLAHEDERAFIAANGQKRTLSDHTYAKRMKVVSDELTKMLYGSCAKLGRDTILWIGDEMHPSVELYDPERLEKLL